MLLFGAAVVVALLVAIALGHVLQQDSRYRRLKGADFTAGARAVVLPRVAVVVPARNESRNIASCLDGLRRQFYPNDRLQLIVVDDNSTDDTAAIVRRIASEDDRVTLIDAGALPPGWAGKPHACWRGANGAAAEWLCFVDADTRAAPALLRTAVVAAQRRSLAMLSLAPLQELSSFHDRLLLPLGFLIIAATQDVTRLTGTSPGGAVANGQFILVEAKAYFALGGHAAVRAAICEDRALACRFFDGGRRLAMLGGETLICAHMYRGARELWQGLSKNLVETFGGVIRTLAIAAGTVAVVWAPPALTVLALRRSIIAPEPAAIAAFVVAGIVTAALLVMLMGVASYFHIPIWYALVAPLGALMAAAIALNAVLWRTRGRVVWKGRIYRTDTNASAPGA